MELQVAVWTSPPPPFASIPVPLPPNLPLLLLCLLILRIKPSQCPPTTPHPDIGTGAAKPAPQRMPCSLERTSPLRRTVARTPGAQVWGGGVAAPAAGQPALAHAAANGSHTHVHALASAEWKRRCGDAAHMSAFRSALSQRSAPRCQRRQHRPAHSCIPVNASTLWIRSTAWMYWIMWLVGQLLANGCPTELNT